MRVSQDRAASASAAILDSQSVKSATPAAIEVGYDAAKQIKGRKRHLLVDTLGLVMMVVVTAASVPERAGAKSVFARLEQVRHWCSRLTVIWVDGGYQGQGFMRWVMDTHRWMWRWYYAKKLRKASFLCLSVGLSSGHLAGLTGADDSARIMRFYRKPQKLLSTWQTLG